jgi:hypothetical protein
MATLPPCAKDTTEKKLHPKQLTAVRNIERIIKYFM